jgi:hypothetical protein
MSSQEIHPKWWRLYLVFPLLIALFMIDFRLRLSERGHRAAQIGILLIVYGFIHLWLKANAAALSNMDQRQFQGTFTVIRVPLRQLSGAKNEKQPMLQLPNSELQGTLNNIFEIDYIDAEFIPMDEAAEGLNKE